MGKGEDDMAQIYHILSVAAFVAAGVSLCLAVFFWFRFGVWKLIGDLSGRNARKSIRQMRLRREKAAGCVPHFYTVTEKWEGSTEASGLRDMTEEHA